MKRLDPQEVMSALNLPAAWAGRSHYVFVLGDIDQLLAMLLVCQTWHKDPHRPRSLHFICAPPSWKPFDSWWALARERVPELINRVWISALEAGWPIDVPGVQRTELDGYAVTLTWCFGEQVKAEALGVRADNVLSGFDQRLGNRGERWRLNELQPVEPVDCHPWSWSARAPDPRQALVVGAGFAGMGVAHSLARRGWRVTVVDRGWQTDGKHVHTNHLAAALTPVASKDDNVRARLSRAGALCASQRWMHLREPVVSRCGALQLQRSTGRTKPLDEVVGALGWSPQWISHVTAEQASDMAGVRLSAGGIWYPFGSTVRPGLFIDALSQTPGVTVIPFDVHRIRRENGRWQVLNPQGHTMEAPLMVMANAGGIRTVLSNSELWPKQGRLSHMHALAGQITMIPARWLGGGPRCIVGGEGYVLPEVEGWCVSGGTYVRDAVQAEITEKGVQENLSRASALLSLPKDLQCPPATHLPGWAGWRSVLPGRLPAIGPLEGQDGLWIATGYASRGLTWSALAGELIAGYLEAEPLLLDQSILKEIKPI